MSSSTKFEFNSISGLSANAQKLFDQSEPQNNGNSVEWNQKIISSGPSLNEFIHQIWA